MRFLITGSGSSLAQEVNRRLSLKGHDVRLVGRNTSPKFELEDPADCMKKTFRESHVMIHFAHSFEKQIDLDVNQTAAEEIIEASKYLNIKRIIFISSESASKDSKSKYGQSKFRTEKTFLTSEKTVVLRLGIIPDENIESPFTLVRKFVQNFKFLIFPSVYKKIFRVTNLEDVVEAIEIVCDKDIYGGPFCCSKDNRLISILEILKSNGMEPKFVISIPIKAIILLAYSCRKLRLYHRLFDSIISISTDPEECKTIFSLGNDPEYRLH